MLSLEKKSMVNLQKEVGIVLAKNNADNIVANVVLVLDDSGSMAGLYRNGQVQNLAERLVALGAAWDPDKKIQVYRLNGSTYVGEVGVTGVDGWVSRNVSADGGTRFAPVIRDIVSRQGNSKPGLLGKFFGSKEQAPTVPTFVFFLTDGENSDHYETEQALREASNHALFFQFVGIGHETFNFLQRLDDLQGRRIDNANFFKFNERDTDETLFKNMLKEFPGWIPQAKAAGLLK